MKPSLPSSARPAGSAPSSQAASADIHPDAIVEHVLPEALGGIGPQADGAEPEAGVAVSLRRVLLRHASLQGVSLDPMQLRAVVREDDAKRGFYGLRIAVVALGQGAPHRLGLPDRANLPMLCFLNGDWSLIVDQDPDGEWVLETEGGPERRAEAEIENHCFHIEWRSTQEAADEVSDAPFSAAITRVLMRYRRSVIEAGIASAFIGALALMTSMFSMQVYDRVIPLKGEYTLFVLGIGVLISIGVEQLMRRARANVMHEVAVGMDGQLSREIFQRFLRIRLDQLPTDVGSLAGMLRGYEQIRNFYTASTLFALIDIPMALLFVALIAHFASPIVAAVPFFFAFCAIAIGFFARRRFMKLAAEGAQLGYSKTGLLVEAVEGAETIKSGAGGWKFLSRWMRLNAEAIHNDLKLRRSSETVTHASGAIQQLSYAGLIGVGAYVVMSGDMTTGSLVACSILSNRVLQPIVMLPNLMLQHAHARAAVSGLDKLYKLKNDNDGVSRALIPSTIRGHYRAETAAFVYADNPPSLLVDALEIRPGERVGVLGPIGSGKSTLLRLLSGLYAARQGRVLIDGLDISHVSRDSLSRHIGYEMKRGNTKGVHPWLINSETAVIRGEVVARVAKQLRAQGWEPDVVVGHAGWGEMMFIREALPNSRIVSFCEYWYKSQGGDANFDPEFPNAPDAPERCAVRNMHLAVSLLGSDIGMAPTQWQASLFPSELQSRIAINHDGIETHRLTPDDTAWIRLKRDSEEGKGDGIYRKGDEIVTFVNRNLEPMRGYHQFMRALPAMMERRPKARFVVVGGDKVSYGAAPEGKQGYKEVFLKEVERRIDLSRVHFVNQVPYSTLVSLLRVSAAHVYFTYPFVLSWSMLEAMSLEALVIGSNTPPVAEVIEHGKNGLLTDFFSPDKLANTVCETLERPQDYIELRRAARKTVVERYDYQTVCLPRHKELMGLS